MDATQYAGIHGNHVVVENATSPGPLEFQNLKIYSYLLWDSIPDSCASLGDKTFTETF